MNVLGAKPSETAGPLGSADKNKQWQRELLMERLRRNSSQHKTFQELSKAMRMSMLEKRYALDAVEKSNLQKCLDSMQHCIKVTTRQGLIERLESLSRQLGLKFMEDTSGLFISSDMFYLEIILDNNGNVNDVKVHHECKIEQQSCSELVTCLLKGDFADFTMQLEGLSSIYQLNAEPKIKSKAFVALQAMETDLYNLFMIQNFSKDAQMLLMESSVGIVQKRRGGHPMKLTFFVPPFELLDLETKTMSPLTLEVLSTKNVGSSVTVNLEASSANKLQTSPTVTFNKDSQVPLYSQMTPSNSTMLPATFVLRLNNPLPLCQTLKQAIIQSTDIHFGESKSSSIMDLIVKTSSNGLLQSSTKGLFVNLPDQTHCYFLSENKQMEGSVITNVPFTEPSQVPKILSALRQQALFYTLLASCVRPQSKFSDVDTTTMLEVNATSIQQISVALEHPYEESMATVEFDLSDVANVVCRIYSITNNYDGMAVRLSQIAQKCLSIPITIRALLKFWEQERMKGFNRSIENGNFNLPLGPNDPGGRTNDMRDMKGKSDRSGNLPFGTNGRQFFHTSGVMMNAGDNFGDSNINLFEGSSENVMINQFSMKANHEIGFNEQHMVKECSVGEDFYKSPKSKIDFPSGNFTKISGSNSLGTSTISDSGVATHKIDSITKHSSENISLIANIEKNITLNERSLPEGRDNAENVGDQSKCIQTGQKNENINQTSARSSGVEFSNVLSGMGLERRPGIEIIPITTATSQTVPTTSITITPISSSSRLDKKSNSSRKSDDKNKSERKRKRRKEDSPMGPPDKIMSKQEYSNRSYNSSSKSSDGSQSSDGSSGSSKKYSSSPASKLPSLSVNRPSPKHSPIHSSPKHFSIGTHSPKGTSYSLSSPKHGSSGSSGKPSMSALKSAANSPSPKSDKSNSKLAYRDREKDKDKERERSGKGAHSPKIKSSTVKLKQIDLSAAFLPTSEQTQCDEMAGAIVNSATADTHKSSSTSPPNPNCSNPSKVRKGCLSAVIDKLKSAQNTGDEHLSGNQAPLQRSADMEGNTASGGIIRDKIGNVSSHNKTLSSISNITFKTTSSTSGPTNQSSEYMVKPSLDGMKITINKTRTKETATTNNRSTPGYLTATSKFSPSASGSSPKRHTGLKPGVNSGPASRKAQLSQSSAKGSPFPMQSTNTQNRSNFQKSNSSGNLSTKNSFTSNLTKSVSSSSFSSSDFFKKEKGNKTKVGTSDKPIGSRGDPTDVMKLLRCVSSPHSIDALGFMKSFNSNFQIPKLSARTNDESKKDPNRINSSSAPTTPVSTSTPSPPAVSSSNSSGSSNSSSNDTSTKTSNFVDFITKDQSTKQHFFQTRTTSEITTNPVVAPGSSVLSKVPNYLLPSASPKYIENPNIQLPKEITQIPKSSSSEAISIAFQRDFPNKSSSSSTPSTPIHVTSPPFASPVGPLLLNSTSPAYRPSPVTSPAVNQADEMTMRPPSAPCTVEMIKTTELDLSVKHDNKASEPRTISPNASLNKKPPTTIATSKISFPSSPSVSVHIVKSPVPSPLMVMQSPHSNSPCITDDELMDEALVGIGGK